MPSHKRTRSPTPPPLTVDEEEYLQDLLDADSIRDINNKHKANKEKEGPSWKPGPVSKHHKSTHQWPIWKVLDQEDMEAKKASASGTKKNKRKRKRKNKTKGNKRRKRTSSSNKKPEKKKDTRKRKASMNARGNKSTPPPRSPPRSPPRKSMTRREILKNPILPKLSRKYKPKKGKFGYM